jgi:hypothetical protein
MRWGMGIVPLVYIILQVVVFQGALPMHHNAVIAATIQPEAENL